MITSEDEAAQRARQTYNAAADLFDAPALSFWDYFGRKTIDRLHLHRGAHVLDVACGSGASAIPAAQAVGPAGEVVGVDLAENLLALAKAKAKRSGLENISFEAGDMRTLRFPNGSFDAVICVFGIFFVPDMAGVIRELWRLVRARGRLAVTTWGQDVFEPANSAFWESIARVRPDLYKTFNPWDRISTPAGLKDILSEAGVTESQVKGENRIHSLQGPDDWWTIICGTGYRGTIEQLTDPELEKVRTENTRFIRERGITTLQTNVLYAVAIKK